MKPLISIIIPTKNEANNIDRCLKSIMIQNYKKYEVIVVDNNSIDGTNMLARNYTKNVFNYGPERSAQRNYGARKAKGKVIVFLDADMEIASKHFLSEISTSKFLNSIKDNSYIIPEISKYKTLWERFRAYYRNFVDDDLNVIAPRIFLKKNFIEIGGYDEDLNACEDWDLRDRIAMVTRINSIRSKLYHYENITNIFIHLKKKFNYATYLNHYLKKRKSVPLNPETVFFLRPSYWNMVKTFFKNPKDVIGSTLLLFFELLAGVLGYYYGRFRSR